MRQLTDSGNAYRLLVEYVYKDGRVYHHEYYGPYANAGTAKAQRGRLSSSGTRVTVQKAETNWTEVEL